MTNYLFIDTECGGIGLDKSLLTVSLVLTDENFAEIDKLNLDLIPDDGVYRLTPESLTINKINIIELKKTAITYKLAGTKIYNTLNAWSNSGKTKLIPVGKNIYFDLLQIWDKLLSKQSWENFVSYRILEISSVILFLQNCGMLSLPEGQSTSLVNLCKYFGISTEGSHTAYGDNLLGMECLKKMKNLVGRDYSNFRSYPGRITNLEF